jgi:hypothetical protein
MAAACRRKTRRAIRARRKGHCRQDKARTRLCQEPNPDTFRKRRWARQEGIIGIRNQGSRQQQRLRKERTAYNGIRGRRRKQKPRLGCRTALNKIFRKTVGREIAKQKVGTSISVRTLWRGRPLRNGKRNCTQIKNHGCRSTDQSRNFCLHRPEEDDCDTPGPARTVSGSRSGRATSRREQREQLE